MSMLRVAGRTLRWLVILGVLGAAGYLGYRHFAGSTAEAVTYQTMPIDQGDVVQKVTATGTLSPLVTVEVGSQVSGRISQLFADFNSTVEEGQVLAQLDTQAFQAALDQANANYASARAGLAEAQAQAANDQRQAERLRTLADRNLVAAADAEAAESTAAVSQARIDSAQADVRRARAARDAAQVDVDYATIHSPISGTVISRNVDVGQTVAASLSAPTLFVIAQDLRSMQVDTSVAEADVGQLREGMPVTFTVDAYPDEEFQGTVRQIRYAATTVQNVVTYDAVVDVSNDELKLRPGMTANVTFVVEQRQNVLRIPNAALRFRAPDNLVCQPPGEGSGMPAAAVAQAGGDSTPHSGQWQGGGAGRRHGNGTWQRPDTAQDPGTGAAAESDGTHSPSTHARTVWVLRNGAPTCARVRLGLTDGTHTEILGGSLAAGDAVIIGSSGGSTGATTPPSGGAPGGGSRGGFRMF